jgi:hypothetical protein
MCLCSCHWILAMIYPKEGKIFIFNPLHVNESTYKDSLIVFQGKQHINCVFITNLVITILTNDDPFRISAYKWYVSQGGRHSPKHKEGMYVRYRFPVLTYTSL